MNELKFIYLGLFTILLPVTITCIRNCTNVDPKQLDLVEKCLVHEEIINPHNFSYIHNGAQVACQNNKGEDIFLLVYVHSSARNHKRRLVIRETWANRKHFPKVRVLFMLGFIAEKRIIDLVKYESDIYGDIVQQDFFDAYRNITYKAVMAQQTLSLYCTNVKNVLKTDDDIVVNMNKLLIDLTNSPMSNGTLRCFIFAEQYVIRDKSSKWAVTKEEYPADTYGQYCSGGAYIMSKDLPAKFFNLSLYTRYLWVDDVYITGLLAHLLNVTHVNQNELHYLNFDSKSKLKNTTCFVYVESAHSTHPMNLCYKIWNNFTNFKDNVKSIFPYPTATTRAVRILEYSPRQSFVSTKQNLTVNSTQQNFSVNSTK